MVAGLKLGLKLALVIVGEGRGVELQLADLEALPNLLRRKAFLDLEAHDLRDLRTP